MSRQYDAVRAAFQLAAEELAELDEALRLNDCIHEIADATEECTARPVHSLDPLEVEAEPGSGDDEMLSVHEYVEKHGFEAFADLIRKEFGELLQADVPIEITVCNGDARFSPNHRQLSRRELAAARHLQRSQSRQRKRGGR